MWTRISLKNRIYILLSALFLATCSGSAIMVWYSCNIEKVLVSITDNGLSSLQRAESLEISLVNQKGFLSYYFLDGDPAWLAELNTYRNMFREKLGEIKVFIKDDPDEMEAIARIDADYAKYILEQDSIITAYKNGDGRSPLHQQIRSHFFSILDMCEDYKKAQNQLIMEAKQVALTKAARLRDTAMAVIATHIMLILLLAYLLIYQILNPVRALILETSRGNKMEWTGNDVKTLSVGVRNLIEDVGQIQVELKKSRENLLQAEKMAMVGKLAAGMAHSVRNPFTSVKMRLFSMNRALKLTGTQKEDFDVISEEINHIDTIVQNFLEFSRPPKLKMQSVSPSLVVDTAIQLLHYRLESYNVQVTTYRDKILPPIEADPDQLKEVIVNLMINACEAMPGGGKISIYEAVADTGPHESQVEIRVSDTGIGISPATAKKVFDPFFTTKEEGTGLGLSIVSRIIEEHGGSMSLSSVEGRGTTFTIVLPIKGDYP